MFRLRELEVVHWDYWRRFALPLDAPIVTVVGPNGSGKTTLLDALRTLLAINCSAGRDYKRYVRHADQPYAWLRAVADNPRRGNGQYAFWPITAPQVTLLCRIRKNGGDWTREYAVGPGAYPIDETLDQRLSWIGTRQYEAQLENAGLTRAIKRVLALDQGHTDKLCEYSGRQLLELVFDVFGDKEVLDNYEKARGEQKAVEIELVDLGTQLAGLGVRLEEAEAQVRSYHERVRLVNELADLRAKWLPMVQMAERMDAIRGGRSQVLGKRREANEARVALTMAEAAALEAAIHSALAEATEQAAKLALDAAHEEEKQINRTYGGVETKLKARDELEQLAAQQAGGFDAVAETAKKERLQREHFKLDGDLKGLREKAQEEQERISALAAGRPPESRDVSAFRAALQGERIAHRMLAEIVEITDAHWQGALEAVLAGVRHLVLLDEPAQRERAWALGERLRFRHFVTPDRGEPPASQAGSLLEVLKFKAPPPRWLARMLDDIQRVPDVAAGSRLPADQAWITPSGYYRERRGARDASVSEFHFGANALAQARRNAAALAERIEAAEVQQKRCIAELVTTQSLLAGVAAAAELSARAPEFEAATREMEELSVRKSDVETRRKAAAHGYYLATENTKEVNKAQVLADAKLVEKRDGRKRVQNEYDSARRSRVDHICAWHSLRQGKPPEWRSASALADAKVRYRDETGVQREIERQQKRLDEGSFVTDAHCELKRDKLKLDHRQMAERIERQQENVNRAKDSTERARGQYINVLRATLRRYKANLETLGRLAGIGVEVTYPELRNEELSLAQARLEVQFDFDRKGLIGLNDGEASGGQQVMKSMILLVALMMEDAGSGGFVFIDEPFAHLDIFNIDKVGAFLQATKAQYIVTTPNTHNVNVFQPSDLTLVTQKRAAGAKWAPPVAFLRRDRSAPA